MSRDPLGFGDRGNSVWLSVYLCASNSTLTFSDPSGLSPIGSLDGYRKCWGKPQGLQYVVRRGVFDKIEFTAIFRWLRSQWQVEWKPDPTAFNADCCCCTSVGFVQIVKTSVESNCPLIDFLTSHGWMVDATGQSFFEYKYQEHTNPCVRPVSIATMSDAPGLRDLWSTCYALRPFLLYRLEQKFETCVVCLDGNEGPNIEFRPAVQGGEFASIEGLTVYGCLKWTHSWQMLHRPQSDASDFVTRRLLEGVPGMRDGHYQTQHRDYGE